MGIYMDARVRVIEEGELGERPSWDEYFMKMAISASSRSSCFNVMARAILTFDNRVIGTGYNGAPRRVKSCLERGGCYKESRTGKRYEDSMNSGNCIGVHSEMNAVSHLGLDQKGFTLYSTIMPCNGCAKKLVGDGLGRVVFKSGYDGRELDNVLELFGDKSIEVCQLDMSLRRVLDIDFNRLKVTHDIWSDGEREEVMRMFGHGDS